MPAMIESAVSVSKMACRGATADGARCRNMVQGCGKCSQHADSADAAPPDKILLKGRVNQKWIDRLIDAGIRSQVRDEQALDQRHKAQAEQLGRKPHVISAQKPDSGVPVFGPGGICNLEGREILAELRTNGFAIQAIHFYQRPDDRMATVVVELTKGSQKSSVTGNQILAVTDVFSSTWEHAHIWANPPVNRELVHTINLAHRFPDVRAAAKLRYDNGNWKLSGV